MYLRLRHRDCEERVWRAKSIFDYDEWHLRGVKKNTTKQEDACVNAWSPPRKSVYSICWMPSLWEELLSNSLTIACRRGWEIYSGTAKSRRARRLGTATLSPSKSPPSSSSTESPISPPTHFPPLFTFFATISGSYFSFAPSFVTLIILLFSSSSSSSTHLSFPLLSVPIFLRSEFFRHSVTIFLILPIFFSIILPHLLLLLYSLFVSSSCPLVTIAISFLITFVPVYAPPPPPPHTLDTRHPLSPLRSFLLPPFFLLFIFSSCHFSQASIFPYTSRAPALWRHVNVQ